MGVSRGEERVGCPSHVRRIDGRAVPGSGEQDRHAQRGERGGAEVRAGAAGHVREGHEAGQKLWRAADRGVHVLCGEEDGVQGRILVAVAISLLDTTSLWCVYFGMGLNSLKHWHV